MISTPIYEPTVDFMELYFQLRKKEGRVYRDEEVLHLPDIGESHPHYEEWQARKRSAGKLISWLEKKRAPFSLLEIGCGNGWLSRRLAGIQGADVTGTDINFAEIQQAKRVFSHFPNLQFHQGDHYSVGAHLKEYNFIVLAACIQYISPLEEWVNGILDLLRPDGELHILDSPFYENAEMNAAKSRTISYYAHIGFPQMSQHYHHHALDELRSFSYKILYRPSYFNRHVLNNKNPFPWICITKPGTK